MKTELPKGAVMAKELAEKELEKWFDFRRVKDKVRNSPDDTLGYDPNRETVVDGFVYGQLTFDESTGILKQKLDYPIETESKNFSLKELNWKARIKKNDLTAQMKGVKSTDSDARMEAYIAAYTGTARNHIGLLDLSDDYSLAQAINTYFLL